MYIERIGNSQMAGEAACVLLIEPLAAKPPAARRSPRRPPRRRDAKVNTPRARRLRNESAGGLEARAMRGELQECRRSQRPLGVKSLADQSKPSARLESARASRRAALTLGEA